MVNEPTANEALQRSDTLAEQLVSLLSERIVRGIYKPGSSLIETEIALELGVSRSPLREALRVLSEQGFVEIRSGRGAFVSLLTAREAAEFYDTRAILESHCTGLATEAMDAEQLAELDAAYHHLVAAANEDSAPNFRELNSKFHLQLYSYCPNQTLISLVNSFWRRASRYSRLLRLDSKRSDRILRHKHELMGCIRSRDSVAAKEVMRKLILYGKDDLIAAVEDGDPFTYWDRQYRSASQ